MSNKDTIAGILHEIGVMLEMKGENRFKSLAYTHAARTLETLAEDLGELIRTGRLGELKGIGAALCEKITELYETGKLQYYEELKASIPEGLFDCLKVPGLGPKKVKALWEKLDVKTLADLKMCCERNLVSTLAGFGEKTQIKILEGLGNLEKYRGQFLWIEAWKAAEPVMDSLRDCPAVRRVELAGSLRRKKEVVRDLDFVAATDDPKIVMKVFTSLANVKQVVNQGETKASVMLEGGLQADLRCVSDAEFPFALAYFTGSKEHNVALRQRCLDQRMKLNEYGLFRIGKNRGEGSGEKVLCRSEADIYRKLGLDYVEPELRENTGEIDAAAAGELPVLVTEKDIRGSFHAHTRWSDGSDTLEQMAEAAQALGWEYLGITEHSRSSVVAGGLDAKRLLEQADEIRELNKRWEGRGKRFRLFAGCEVDVLGDGRLDYPDDLLAQLDFVMVSIHQGFSSDEARQTARLVKAIENPMVTMVGHPTGRLLLEREQYRVDLNAVIEAAARHGKIIELNCTPVRMDMDWRWWKNARDRGVLCAINRDAHAADQLAEVGWGVQIARKGWLRAKDVLNTRTGGEVEKILRRIRGTR
ncbi:MAG: DNA polymerase/3'-5' exonuclease PolX [Verrucomicrobiae bacterium]|nr:DNA polymerase/3'-5' exonuclease PolX [Verrucomicrobiae bacterium]